MLIARSTPRLRHSPNQRASKAASNVLVADEQAPNAPGTQRGGRALKSACVHIFVWPTGPLAKDRGPNILTTPAPGRGPLRGRRRPNRRNDRASGRGGVSWRRRVIIARVKEEDIYFYSDGHQLVGTLYAPDDMEAKKLPHIIVCSGYKGFNAFYPRLFSRYLTKSGYSCLGFDYRGFAESGGPRGRVILPEQVEDIKNSITFAQTLPQVDKEKIGLLGWGMGATNVVELAGHDERVKAVAAVNGFYDGERWLKSTHTPESWNDLLKAVEEDRVRRVTTGKSKRVESFHHYSLDPDTEAYVQAELDPLIEMSGRRVDLQLTESILAAKPENVAAAISPRPLFVGHGRHNKLHPPQASEQLYAKAEEPKTLYWIDGKHNDFMYEGHPVLGDLAARLAEFFMVLEQA